MASEAVYNLVGSDRITSRQIDELVGLARGIAADGMINQAEVEFLQKWLAANMAISDQPMIRRLYERVNGILADGIADPEECRDLLDTLNSFSSRDFELGEVLKATTLPLCDPAPTLRFAGQRYCFTGTFNFGGRRNCEDAVGEPGGSAGSLTKATKRAGDRHVRDRKLEALLVRDQDRQGGGHARGRRADRHRLRGALD